MNSSKTTKIFGVPRIAVIGGSIGLTLIILGGFIWKGCSSYGNLNERFVTSVKNLTNEEYIKGLDEKNQSLIMDISRNDIVQSFNDNKRAAFVIDDDNQKLVVVVPKLESENEIEQFDKELEENIKNKCRPTILINIVGGRYGLSGRVDKFKTFTTSILEAENKNETKLGFFEGIGSFFSSNQHSKANKLSSLIVSAMKESKEKKDMPIYVYFALKENKIDLKVFKGPVKKEGDDKKEEKWSIKSEEIDFGDKTVAKNIFAVMLRRLAGETEVIEVTESKTSKKDEKGSGESKTTS